MSTSIAGLPAYPALRDKPPRRADRLFCDVVRLKLRDIDRPTMTHRDGFWYCELPEAPDSEHFRVYAANYSSGWSYRKTLNLPYEQPTRFSFPVKQRKTAQMKRFLAARETHERELLVVCEEFPTILYRFVWEDQLRDRWHHFERVGIKRDFADGCFKLERNHGPIQEVYTNTCKFVWEEDSWDHSKNRECFILTAVLHNDHKTFYQKKFYTYQEMKDAIHRFIIETNRQEGGALIKDEYYKWKKEHGYLVMENERFRAWLDHDNTRTKPDLHVRIVAKPTTPIHDPPKYPHYGTGLLGVFTTKKVREAKAWAKDRLQKLEELFPPKEDY